MDELNKEFFQLTAQALELQKEEHQPDHLPPRKHSTFAVSPAGHHLSSRGVHRELGLMVWGSRSLSPFHRRVGIRTTSSDQKAHQPKSGFACLVWQMDPETGKHTQLVEEWPGKIEEGHEKGAIKIAIQMQHK